MTIETESYIWYFHKIHGVGGFIRKSDDAMTLLETGVDAIELCDTLERMHESEFDEFASKQTFQHC
jgi:hypothetical protein